MFARVITAQTQTQGLQVVQDLFTQQLPGARQQPGFAGFYLLTNAETGKAMIISLWESREQMPAGIQGPALPVTWATPPELETYEVTLHG
jgi:heme-degrading monooxygenase HmoA